jgi:hypothetical protein
VVYKDLPESIAGLQSDSDAGAVAAAPAAVNA